MTVIEQKMIRLLESEREMLLGGDLGGLAELSKEKEALLPNMRHLDGDAQTRLRSAADQNHALLGAAMRGLRGAIRRINAISGAGAPLQTYAANGDRATLSQPRRRDLETRA
ncbi:MAG: hypothetical protein AAGK92_01600 [Pseudomonadota bacterium]